MLTVYRLELKRSFTTVFGALILSALLLCNGVIMTVYNLAYGTASLAQTQDILTVVYLILIPVLACKALPQERKDGTDAFLYSLSISSSAIAVGKYLALATVLGVSFLPLWISPMIFSAYGTVSVGTLLIHWITFFLLCLLLLAICYCASAFVKRPIYAALLGVGVLALIYFFPLLASWTSNHLLVMEPFHLLAGASYGRLDLMAIALYAGGIALCLLIVTCVIEYRRTGLGDGCKTGIRRLLTTKTVACLLTAVALAVLSIASPLLPQKVVRPALATDDAFELSNETRSVLSELNGDITVSYLCSGGIHTAQGALYSFLRDYAESSPRVTLRVIDTVQEKDALSGYEGADALENMSVIVESESRYRVINNTELYYYYNSTVGNYRITPEEYSYFCNYLAQVSSSELYTFVAGTVSYFDGETVLTNAIRYCLQPTVTTVYTFGSAGTLTTDAQLLSSLKLEGYDCRALTDTARIPNDCALLIIDGPTKDLTAAEAEAVSAYLARGGKIFLTTASSSIVTLPELRGLLSSYGMSVIDQANIVCEGKAEYCYTTLSSTSTAPNLFLAHINGSSALTGDFDGTVVVPNAHAIDLTETEGITHTRWLYTSDSAYVAEAKTGENLEENDARASRTVGALAESASGGSILWISSPNVASSVADSYVYGGNFKLLLGAIHTLTAHTGQALTIPAAALELSMISVGNSALAVWAVILCVALPLAVLLGGCTAVYLKKRR